MSATNVLQGYDMIYAVSQEAINTQLEWLFGLGIIKSRVAFGDLGKNGLCFEGELDTPTIILGDKSIGHLLVRFVSGTLQYYEGFGQSAELKRVDLDGTWRLAFEVKLNIAKLGRDFESENKQVPDSIRETLNDFHSSGFRVKHIFLDFQNSHMASYHEPFSEIPVDSPMLKANFGAMLGAWIKQKNSDNNPFILAYAAEAPKNEISLFQPRRVNYSSRRHQPFKEATRGLSTFQFLILTSDRDFPVTDPVFAENFLSTGAPDGLAIVSRDLVDRAWIENLILPQILDSFKQAFKVDVKDATKDLKGDAKELAETLLNEFNFNNAAWQPNKNGSYDLEAITPEHTTYFGLFKDLVKTSWAKHKFVFRANAVLRNETPTGESEPRPALVIGGSWGTESRVNPAPFKAYNESRKQSFSYKIFFRAGRNGAIEHTVEQSIGEPVHDTDLPKVEEIFIKITTFLLGLISPFLVVIAALVNARLFSTLGILPNIHPLDVHLKSAQNQVVLPAPGVFFYKDLFLDKEGNIRLSITYKTETKVC